MRILVVEDEVKLAALIRRGLREEMLLTDVAIRGEDALWMAGTTEYDVIVLDWMLPGIDGIETMQQLRAQGVTTPILMLTARDAVADRISGLNAGADDYLAKPFAFGELLARIHAVARRAQSRRSSTSRIVAAPPRLQRRRRVRRLPARQDRPSVRTFEHRDRARGGVPALTPQSGRGPHSSRDPGMRSHTSAPFESPPM